MPLSLFGNKFSPKKGLARKSPSLSNLNLDSTEKKAEFGIDHGPIKINLGNNTIHFEDGKWISDSGGANTNIQEMKILQKENLRISEENNLLKIKVELLLNMLSETTAEVHLQENEIEQLKICLKKK